VTDFLSEIELKTIQRVAQLKKEVSHEQLRKRLSVLPKTISFSKALHRPGIITVIAELKQASPSAGIIRQEADLSGRLKGYVDGGAAALSILTEEEYFHGSPQLLEQARRETRLPLLRKDFIIDLYQIDESRVLGADAILLITALFKRDKLKTFLSYAQERHLEVLLEIHDEEDLEKAVYSGAKIIGINNRDLRSLKVDPLNAQKLLPMIPKKDHILVVESGIRDPEQLLDFREMGANAALIGEALMRNPDPKQAVQSFVTVGKQ